MSNEEYNQLLTEYQLKLEDMGFTPDEAFSLAQLKIWYELTHSSV